VHAVADVHDTPDRLLTVGPLGLGVVWIVQLEPSQRSANGPPLLSPTAVHAMADAHDTADRMPPPLGLGVLWTVQRRSSAPPAGRRC
jgi:hypothetical protein